MSPFTMSAQLYWNHVNLESVKIHLSEEPYQKAYQALIRNANKYLAEPNLSVVDDKEHIPASGNIHDYMSIGRYTWPDTTKTNGLPYKSRDGYTNPEYYTYDREVLLKMVERVKILTLSWYFSDERKYAVAAIEQLRVWFNKKDTRMNPNMYYGMMVKGYQTLNPNAVHEGTGFVDLLDALYLLDGYYAWEWHSDLRKIKEWFGEFLDWIETSDQGVRVSKVKDNIGTTYELQRLAYNLYCGRSGNSQKILESFIENRLYKQIDANGVQVEEIKRTSSFGYSVSNISVMTNFIVMAQNQGLKLSTSAMERFYKAVDYLILYLDESKKWPYQEIQNMDYYRKRLCFELYRIAICIDTSRIDLLQLYEHYGKMNDNNINNLIYGK